MSKGYTHIIFDLDGTLMDTYPGAGGSFARTAQALGLRAPTEEEKRSMIGPPLEDSFERIYGLKGEEVQHALDVFNALYATMEGAGNSVLYPGVLDTLERLKARGIKLTVATMKPWIFTEIALSHSDVLRLFDAVACYEDNSGITKAQLALRTLKETGGDAAHALFVGDSGFDGRGAAEAGIDFAALLGGFGFRSEADLAGIPYVVTGGTIPDLWDYLEANLAK